MFSTPFTFLKFTPSVPVYDPDAEAFFTRVTAAGGSLTLTEKDATNQLVLDLKSYSIWSAMKVIYPMVGSSAAACAQNLTSSSFTGAFSGGWTFASTGVTPNGSNGYMNTNCNPVTQGYGINNQSFGGYVRTNLDLTLMACVVPVTGTTANQLVQVSSTVLYPNVSSTWNAYNINTSKPFYIASRVNGSEEKVYLNGTLIYTTAASSNVQPNANYELSRWNGSSPQFYSTNELAFVYIGDGLSAAQAANFYTTVQAFNTTLSRQV